MDNSKINGSWEAIKTENVYILHLSNGLLIKNYKSQMFLSSF